MTRYLLPALLALCACAEPMPGPDRPATDATTDARAPDGASPMDAGANDAQPLDATIPPEASTPPGPEPGPEAGPRDAAPEASAPRCQLDPRNCGMCGRVCGEGMLGGRPACAEVLPGQWDCVNNCAGFGEGCGYPGGGAVCCVRGCGPIDTGCR